MQYLRNLWKTWSDRQQKIYEDYQAAAPERFATALAKDAVERAKY